MNEPDQKHEKIPGGNDKPGGSGQVPLSQQAKRIPGGVNEDHLEGGKRGD